MMNFLNISYRKVGGLTFIKVGRLTLSFSIASAYKPMATEEQTASKRARTAELRRLRRFVDWAEQQPMPVSFNDWEYAA